MNLEQALKIVSKQAPCPHHNSDTTLGNGKIWARCEDCGVTFPQNLWHKAKESAKEFEEAMLTLTTLARNVSPAYLPIQPPNFEPVHRTKEEWRAAVEAVLERKCKQCHYFRQSDPTTNHGNCVIQLLSFWMNRDDPTPLYNSVRVDDDCSLFIRRKE